MQCSWCPNILNWQQWFQINCSNCTSTAHSADNSHVPAVLCRLSRALVLTLWPRYWPCGPSTGTLCYSGSFGPGAGFVAFWSSINYQLLCAPPHGCKTNRNFLTAGCVLLKVLWPDFLMTLIQPPPCSSKWFHCNSCLYSITITQSKVLTYIPKILAGCLSRRGFPIVQRGGG